MQKKAYEDLVAEVQELRAQLEEAQETLNAIRRGEVDGLVISTPKGEQVYTISGAERPYRALIEDMREGAVMLSDDNTVLYCNSGFAKMMKRPAEKIVGDKIESMVCPTYIPALTELLTQSRAHKGAVNKEVTLQAREDVLVPTLMSVNSLQSDTLKNTFLVVTDLSEHMEEEVKRYTSELELAQIALSESEQRWATTLASIGDAVIATDKLGYIKFMNGVAEELTGWTLKEASKRPVQEIFKIVNEFSRKTVDDPVSKVLKSGIICGLANHTILIRKDKSEVAIDDSGAPIRDKEGRTAGVVLIFRDISERRKAEEALNQSKEMEFVRRKELEALMETVPATIWITHDPECLNMTGNKATYDLVGLPKRANVSETAPEEQRPTNFLAYDNQGKPIPLKDLPMQVAAQTGKPVRNSEFEFRFADGRSVWVHGNVMPLLDAKGKPQGAIGAYIDITERKNAEEALKERETLYKSLFDNSQDGFQLLELLYGEDGKAIDFRYLKINNAYERIVGVKAVDIEGKTAREVFPNYEQNWLEVPQRVNETGKTEHVELFTRTVNKYFDLYYFPYSRNIVGTLFRDITERKNLEKQLQEKERLAAIGATAGMVGHDIRNPLQAIVGDLYLAKEEINEIPNTVGRRAMLETVGEIEKNVDYINKIVADLQDFARPLNPNIEEADLKRIIDDLLSKNGLPENVKVSVNIEVEASKFTVDSSFINRIMNNLVSNAVQAMPKGGTLVIHAFKEANDVVIKVKDTGVGIPDNVKAKLFTPMFTTKARGQGFGLVVIKRMTEALGGKVSFESQEGKGTTFEVRLPSQKVKS